VQDPFWCFHPRLAGTWTTVRWIEATGAQRVMEVEEQYFECDERRGFTKGILTPPIQVAQGMQLAGIIQSRLTPKLRHTLGFDHDDY
jgi:hypothetical protein